MTDLGLLLLAGLNAEWLMGSLLGVMIGLALLALGFGLITVFLRARNDGRASHFGDAERFWTPHILDALEDPDSIQELAAGVPARDREAYLRTLFRLAVRIRGIEQVRIEALARPHLHLTERMLRDSRPEERAQAVRTLGTLDPASHREALLHSLKDPSPLVAMTAARALCRPDDPEGLERVLRTMERFEWWSRGFLASILAGAGAEASEVLRGILADPSASISLRAVAAETLTRLDDLDAASVAASVLESSEGIDIRVSCLHLLAATGRPEHVELVRRLTSDPAFPVRAAAFRALGQLGGRADLDLLAEGMATDPSPWAALRAGQALLAAGGRHILEAEATRDDPMGTLARQALSEAGVLG